MSRRPGQDFSISYHCAAVETAGFPGAKSVETLLGLRDHVPAELPKQAASFDLPITLGVLAGSGQIASEKFEEYAVVGELSLEGLTRPVKGALSMAIAAAREKGLKGLVVPTASAPEAAVVEEIVVIPVASLTEAVAFFTGELEIEPAPSRLSELFETFSKYDEDFADVRGQEMAKRAITIAAAGSHNLLSISAI